MSPNGETADCGVRATGPPERAPCKTCSSYPIISYQYSPNLLLIPPPHSRVSPLEEQIARRRFPRVDRQLWLLLQRGTIKYLRAFWPLRIIDSLLLLVAAFIIGEGGASRGGTRAWTRRRLHELRNRAFMILKPGQPQLNMGRYRGHYIFRI